MSSKPTHSFDAIARRMMMSRHRLFVFVEGKRFDVPFFDGLVNRAVETFDVSHVIYTAPYITPNGTGGKAALKDLYRWLRARRKLNQGNSATIVSALFAMDKDFDDVIVGRSRSKHVILTHRYNVEAEIFSNAPLAKALVPGVSLSALGAEQVADDLGDWVHDLSEIWSEWLRLCVISVALRSSSGISPKRQSTIQRVPNNAYSACDPGKAAAAENEVTAKACCPDPMSVSKEIDERLVRLYRRAGYDTILNGKHLASYLEYRLKMHPVARSGDLHNFASAAAKVFLSQLNYSEAWAIPYVKAVRHFLP